MGKLKLLITLASVEYKETARRYSNMNPIKTSDMISLALCDGERYCTKVHFISKSMSF